MWMLYFSLSSSLSLIFIASHGFPSPADIWSHKRYICCYNHWHLLASGHRLCQCWLFLLGGGVNATGAAAAAAAAQNQWLWACSVFRLQPNPGALPGLHFVFSPHARGHRGRQNLIRPTCRSSPCLQRGAEFYDPVCHGRNFERVRLK